MILCFIFILCPSSTLNLHPLSLFLVGLVIGTAAQKSHKRRVHIASLTSHSVTVTQLPEMGSTFASSTGTLPNLDKLHSLYAHTSHRTHSTSSTLSGLTVSSTSNHRSQLEGQSQIYKSRFDRRKAFKWKPMLDPQMVTKWGDYLHVGLHKVLGMMVKAIIGGIYHQFIRLSIPLLPFPPHH